MFFLKWRTEVYWNRWMHWVRHSGTETYITTTYIFRCAIEAAVDGPTCWDQAHQLRWHSTTWSPQSIYFYSSFPKVFNTRDGLQFILSLPYIFSPPDTLFNICIIFARHIPKSTRSAEYISFLCQSSTKFEIPGNLPRRLLWRRLICWFSLWENKVLATWTRKWKEGVSSSVDIARLLRTHSTDRSHPWSVDTSNCMEGRCTTSGCEWLSRLALWSVSVVAGKGLKFKFSVQTSMAEDTRTPLKQPITLGSSQPNLRYSCST